MNLKQKIIILLLMFTGSILVMNAQEKESSKELIVVKGTVKSEKGERLKGVVVTARPTKTRLMEEIKNGTLSSEPNYVETNMAGKYSIQVYIDDSLAFNKDDYAYKMVAATDIGKDDTILFEHNLGEEYPVIGTVADDQGNKLDKVHIMSKYNRRTNNGEYKQRLEYIYNTSEDGVFRLYMFEKIILVFQKDGYETREIPVSDLANKDDIIIVLKKKKD